MALNLRKIPTEEEKRKEERRKKRNMIILSVLLIGILVFSTAGGFFSGIGDESGNGADGSAEGVQQVGDEWVLNANGQVFRFGSSPEDARNVSIQIKSSFSDLYGKTLYVASENDAAYYQIYMNLGNYLERVQQVCYGNCTKNLPEKNCSTTMIVFKQSSEDKIYQEEGCVFIDGNLRTVDAFIYKLLGLI